MNLHLMLVFPRDAMPTYRTFLATARSFVLAALFSVSSALASDPPQAAVTADPEGAPTDTAQPPSPQTEQSVPVYNWRRDKSEAPRPPAAAEPGLENILRGYYGISFQVVEAVRNAKYGNLPGKHESDTSIGILYTLPGASDFGAVQWQNVV